LVRSKRSSSDNSDDEKKTYGPFIGMLAYSPEKINEISSFEVQEMGSELNQAGFNIIICNGTSFLSDYISVSEISKKMLIVNLRLKIQCHIVKNTLLQIAFSAIFPTGILTYTN